MPSGTVPGSRCSETRRRADHRVGLAASKRRLWLPWRERLDRVREDAARNLNCPLTGIYKKVAGILEGTEDWENDRTELH